MNRHSKKGSALLIVLGFLSFMVVSAVAFAIWMRTERIPSSSLRRTVANRYLVKAALAQAMSRVDDAIRSHVFPGAWHTNNTNLGTSDVNVYRNARGYAYDWWEARVFMPPEPEGKEKDSESGNVHHRYAPITKTVSVLNLEALGYLPPSIVNDVRLLARSSWAAQWDYFNFDAGRYAFCAVNVSDMLDITKMAADSPRTSAPAMRAQKAGKKPEPPSRFSLAYLFRKNVGKPDQDKFDDVDGMDSFDEAVHAPQGWSSAPLVSILDYNLSVGSKNVTLRSPFYDYINGDIKGRAFYGSNDGTHRLVKLAERQPFVTASWFPPSEYSKSDGSANTPLDISKNLPFPNGWLQNGDDKTLVSFVQNGGTGDLPFWYAMKQNSHTFCILDQFTLFDYLDEDDEPLSLAMPCAERVPMITALAPLVDMKVEFTPMKSTGDPDMSQNDWRETSEANIKITFGGTALGSTIVFPFNDSGNGQRQNKNFSAQAFARLVFVAGNAAGSAATAAPISLRNNGFAKNFRPMRKEEWTDNVDDDKQFSLKEGTGSGKISRTSAENCLVVTLPSQGDGKNVSLPNEIHNERDIWKDNDRLLLELKSPGTGRALEKPILRKVDVYERSGKAPNYTRGQKKETYYEVLLRPFNENGEVLDIAGQYKDGKIPDKDFPALSTQYVIQPYLVTWARVEMLDDDKKTVDMVPATYEDDLAFNERNNASMPNFREINEPLGNTPSDLSGRHALPIIRFQNSMSFTYDDVNTSKSPSGDWVEKSCYAVDPRFNWAPENWWFDKGDAEPSGQKWYDAVFGNGSNDDNSILNKLVRSEFDGGVDHRGDRANDPLLFVSNLGYLQSVGELAFLPHLSNMRENGSPVSVLGDSRQTIESGSFSGALYDGKPRDLTTVATMPCALAAWKSYQSFRTNRNGFEFGANLYRRGLVNPSQCFYVNPFTQSQEVMLAALANSPLNYWVAGENYDCENKKYKEDEIQFDKRKKWMFGSDSNPALKGQDLNKVATFLRRRFEDLASMIDIPTAMREEDLYAYQKVWEDMFDALDWSGTMNCTIANVYEALEKFYKGGEGNGNNYRESYNQYNGYEDINRFARGGGAKKINTGIRITPSKAVHWDEDKNLMADPLRGQIAGDNTGDTSCYQDFFDVDRMFLYSYWRDCFANRQQLFLIFVRAESTALGGAGEGTPAQQGGRAVALVWRDPDAPASENVMEGDGLSPNDIKNVEGKRTLPRHPHKMRILFYRQFE